MGKGLALLGWDLKQVDSTWTGSLGLGRTCQDPIMDSPSYACEGSFGLSALNVKVRKFNQVWVNSGSNYDSLKVAKCLVI